MSICYQKPYISIRGKGLHKIVKIRCEILPGHRCSNFVIANRFSVHAPRNSPNICQVCQCSCSFFTEPESEIVWLAQIHLGQVKFSSTRSDQIQPSLACLLTILLEGVATIGLYCNWGFICLQIHKKIQILSVFTWNVSKDTWKLLFFQHFSDQNEQNLDFFCLVIIIISHNHKKTNIYKIPFFYIKHLKVTELWGLKSHKRSDWFWKFIKLKNAILATAIKN